MNLSTDTVIKYGIEGSSFSCTIVGKNLFQASENYLTYGLGSLLAGNCLKETTQIVKCNDKCPLSVKIGPWETTDFHVTQKRTWRLSFPRPLKVTRSQTPNIIYDIQMSSCTHMLDKAVAMKILARKKIVSELFSWFSPKVSVFSPDFVHRIGLI